MAERYRTISVKIWGDEKFRRLSTIKPSGQALFLYLIIHPSAIIPGFITRGEMSLSEELGWELKAFREAFAEVFREGLAQADWKARFVWLPKAIKHNPPVSANVVKSWHSARQELPECELRVTAIKQVKAFLDGKHEDFAKAFAEVFPEAIQPTFPKEEQEQDREQDRDQELEKSISSPSAPAADAAVSEPEVPKSALLSSWQSTWNTNRGSLPEVEAWGAKRTKCALARLKSKTLQKLGYIVPDDYAGLIQWLAADEFYGGRKTEFKADFDFLIRSDDQVVKFHEKMKAPQKGEQTKKQPTAEDLAEYGF